MDRLVPVLILLCVFIGALALMRAGWKSRARAQSSFPAPPVEPSRPSGSGRVEEVGPFTGVYVSTTVEGLPLERVIAHSLGVRSRVQLSRTAEGDWYFDREGEPPLLVEGSSVTGTGTAAGMAGKFIGGDGLFVLHWKLGDEPVQTGVRLDRREDHDRLLEVEV